MSKINRVRIINLNYNNNTMKIDDEVFDLNGETTLLSLRNGGGKTVLVQMIISLFVHKKYRDFGDRAFNSYFTTNKPTIIMTEWRLDQGNGYFLTGMMVRKNQSPEESEEALEMINFTGFYKQACDYDMDNIPLITVEDKKKHLKGFGNCKQQFEWMHRKKENDFQYYDMNQQYQSAAYFKKLKEYQINYKEWENIIKKVNNKESGLSELFSEAKDERGLIEKWFLEAIENKLNQDSNRIRSFQELSFKFLKQYKENESKIEKKAVIKKYFEDVKEIFEQIDRYQDAEDELHKSEDEIAMFLKEVSKVIIMLRQQESVQEEEIAQLQKEIVRINHEKRSYEIYQLKNEKAEAVAQRIESEVEMTRTKKKKERADKELSRYDCAKLYEEWCDFRNVQIQIQQQIEQKRNEQQENSSEVEDLGRKLHYCYDARLKANMKKREQKQQELQKTEKDKKNAKQEIKQEEQVSKAYHNEVGKLEEAINRFDRMEQEFNRDYRDDLMRNILGRYEEGMLAVKKKKFEEEQNQNQIVITRLAEKNQKLVNNQRMLQDEKAELNSEKNLLERKEEETIKNIVSMEEEVKRRRTILKYMELSEEQLDDKPLILDKLKYKIEELVRIQDGYKLDQKELEKEIINLIEGKIMEIPQRILAFFEDGGIEYCTGMEWLKKNQHTYEENTDLVKRNPLLPYSLIVPLGQMAKIEQIPELYADMPIPVIEREQLEQTVAKQGERFIRFGQITVLCLFNHHLLNPQELEQLVAKKQENLNQILEKIQMKQQEIEEYQGYNAEIEQQRYSKKILEEAKLSLEAQKNRKEEIVLRQNQIKTEIDKTNQQQRENEEKIRCGQQKNDVFYVPRGKALERLAIEYNSYIENQDKWKLRNRQIKESEQKIKNCEETVEVLEGNIQNLRQKLMNLENEEKTLLQQVKRFENYTYESGEENICWEEEEIRLSARYDALTKTVMRDLEDLEEALKKETERLARKERELKEKNIYQFSPKDYEDVDCSAEQSKMLNEVLENAKKEENAAHEKNTKLNSKIAGLKKDIEYRYKELEEQLQTTQLVPENEIVQLEFIERLKLTEYELDEKKKQQKRTFDKLVAFESNKTAMSEYSEFRVSENIGDESEKYDKKLEDFTRDELDKLQGELKRELNKNRNNGQREKEKTADMLRRIGEQESYQSDFFKKGFENCLSLVDKVEDLHHQLDVIYSSYQNILQQLQVDLENIDKERKNIEETFLEYAKDIHKHMERIDKNSNISIRGKNVKMLKIIVPEWEENKELYQIRVKDFMESMITRGLEAIQSGNNVEEILGRFVTSKKLYDDIVGIQNIIIKLYKIEADREIQISWQQVASNSGGEGFLSAFVILTSLLSYMRWDKTDVFAPGNEGKVLIMDNPFAQTNAEHLLKPLVDMAKKTNTQLICLSGIGGESVYNRFDNIYVLNVENSAIHHGLQYIRSEHRKGEMIHKLTLSQFRTEQMSLFDWEEVH